MLRQKEHSIARVVTALDWTGPDDPENPRNWPLWQKIYHTIIPGLFAFVVTFSSSIYTPGYPEVMTKFNVSSSVALLGLSLYVLGLAFGPVLAAPVSETYGRRVVYLVSLPLAAVFTLGAGFSQNAAALMICRFFAGFFGSPVLAVGVSFPILPFWQNVSKLIYLGWNKCRYLASHLPRCLYLRFLTCPVLRPSLRSSSWGLRSPVQRLEMDTMAGSLYSGPLLALFPRNERNLQKDYLG